MTKTARLSRFWWPVIYEADQTAPRHRYSREQRMNGGAQLGDLVPVPRQVRRKDGTVYQAVRHVRMTEQESGGKGWVPPQVSTGAGSEQLAFANIHHALSKRGYSDANISYAIDVFINTAGQSATSLLAVKIRAAINDCIDALGEQDYAFADKRTQAVAERVIIASFHQLPANERVRRLVQDPDVDLDRLISLIKDDRITDPAKLELVLQGGSKTLSDGAL